MKQLKKHAIGFNTVSSIDGIVSAKGVKSKPNNIEVYGFTHEIGEGEKSPDNPYKLISLDSGAMTVDGVGYEHSIKLTNNDKTIQVPFPVALNSVEGVSDYIYKDSDGVWKLVQNLYKLELTGQESGYNREGYTNAYGIKNTTFPLELNFKSSSFSICNILPHNNNSIDAVRYESYRLLYIQSRYMIYFRLLESRVSSLSEFKTYIKNQYDAGTPVTIIYQLKTPIEHVLSDYTQNLLNSFELQNQNEISVEEYPDIRITGYIQK